MKLILLAILSIIILTQLPIEAFATRSVLPDATESACTNWSKTGASYHLDVDDPIGSDDGDTTRIYTSTGSASCEIHLANMSDPYSSNNHIVYVMAKSAGSGAGERIKIGLYEANVLIAESSNITLNRDSYVLESFALSTAQADTMTYNDMSVRITVQTIGGGETITVTQIYFSADSVVPIFGANFIVGQNTVQNIQNQTTGSNSAKCSETGAPGFYDNGYKLCSIFGVHQNIDVGHTYYFWTTAKNSGQGSSGAYLYKFTINNAVGDRKLFGTSQIGVNNKGSSCGSQTAPQQTTDYFTASISSDKLIYTDTKSGVGCDLSTSFDQNMKHQIYLPVSAGPTLRPTNVTYTYDFRLSDDTSVLATMTTGNFTYVINNMIGGGFLQ